MIQSERGESDVEILILNTAVSGWNTVYSGTVGYSSPVLNYSVSSVEVRPSGLSSSYGTGADGIEITIY